jgi:hypothetical protein
MDNLMDSPESPRPDPLEPGPSGLDPGELAVDGEIPEADRIEQAQTVKAERFREARGERPEVDEADWIDQGIVEGDDDDREHT